MMAIQAIDEVVRALQGTVADEASATADDAELLYCYDRAARELRAAYEIERLGSTNLPPYDELVCPD